MNKPETTSFCLKDISINAIAGAQLRGALALEGLPQRRKLDHQDTKHSDLPPREVLKFERIRELVAGLDAGPDMALRVARVVEGEVLKTINDQTIELFEVVRTVAMVAHELNFRPRPSQSNPGAMPINKHHPLYHSSPVVQQARKLCERNGYGADGQKPGMPMPNPEELLLARERGDKDYQDTYRWLLGEARRAGFNSIHAAILAAQPES
jgi:hypothetical protein